MKKFYAIILCLIMLLNIVPVFAAASTTAIYHILDLDEQYEAFGEENYFVKVLTDEGEIEILCMRNKRVDVFTMDDVYYNLDDEDAYYILYNSFDDGDMIVKLTVVNSEIAAIYLPGSEGFYAEYSYGEDSYEEEAYYDAKNMTYGSIQLNENTTVFVFDTYEEDLEDALSVKELTAILEDGYSYNIVAYGPEGKAAEAICVFDPSMSTNPESPVMVVTKISQVVYDDEQTVKLTGIMGGREVSVICDPDEWYGDIEEGNVIIFKEFESLAIDMQVLLASDKRGTGYVFDAEDIVTWPTDESVSVSIGAVEEKTSTYFKIDIDDEYYKPSANGCNYTVVEFGDGYYNAAPGSFNDIVVSDDMFVEAFVKTTKNAADIVTDVVIFKYTDKVEEEPEDDIYGENWGWNDRVLDVNSEEGYIDCENDLVYFDDWYGVTLIKNGKEISINEVLEDDLISVFYNDDDTLTVYVSSEKISGTIEEVYDDTNTINGNVYTVAPWYYGELEAGDRGTFYIDAFGYISYVKPISECDTAEYVYILDKSYTIINFAEENVTLKVLTIKGEEKTLTVQKKRVGIDGDNDYDQYDLYEILDEYNYDEGVVKIILNENGELSGIYFPYFSEEFVCIDNYREDMWDERYRYHAIRGAYGIIDIDSETILYSIETSWDGIENIEVHNATEFLRDGQSYNIVAYGKEDECADVVVVFDATDSFDAEAPLMVVTKVTNYIMNDEQTFKITGIEAGAEKSVIVDPDEYFDEYEIVPGNVIVYSESDGFASNIYPLFFSDVYGSDNWGWGYCDEEIYFEDMSDEYVTMHHGELTDKTSTNFSLYDELTLYPTDDCNYTLVLYSATGMHIKAATASDLAVSAVRPVYVLAKTSKDSEDEVTDVVIYKNADNAQVDDDYEYEVETEYAPDYEPPAEPEYVLLVDVDVVEGDFADAEYLVRVMTTDGEIKDLKIQNKKVTINGEPGYQAEDAFDYIEREWYQPYIALKIALSEKGEINEICLADYDEEFESLDYLDCDEDWVYNAQDISYGDAMLDEETIVFIKDWRCEESNEGLEVGKITEMLKDSWSYEFISYGKYGEAADVLVVMGEYAGESVPHVYAEAWLEGNSAELYIETCNIEPDAKVIVKLTDEEGYTTVVTYPVPEEGWIEDVIEGDFVEVKVLAWSTLDGMTPLCAAEKTMVN